MSERGADRTQDCPAPPQTVPQSFFQLKRAAFDRQETGVIRNDAIESAIPSWLCWSSGQLSELVAACLQQACTDDQEQDALKQDQLIDEFQEKWALEKRLRLLELLEEEGVSEEELEFLEEVPRTLCPELVELIEIDHVAPTESSGSDIEVAAVPPRLYAGPRRWKRGTIGEPVRRKRRRIPSSSSAEGISWRSFRARTQRTCAWCSDKTADHRCVTCKRAFCLSHLRAQQSLDNVLMCWSCDASATSAECAAHAAGASGSGGSVPQSGSHR